MKIERVDPCGYGVPDEVEEKIHYQARGFAGRAKRPDVAEDLAQEGRVGAWQCVVKEGRQTPPAHILSDSWEAMRDYLRLGSSVDGKLWKTYKRDVLYPVLSIDYPTGEKGEEFGEVLPDRSWSVEKSALAMVTYGEIEELLDDEEQQIFVRKMNGETLKEIAAESEYTYWQVRYRFRSVKEKVAGYLNGDLRGEILLE